MSVIETGGDDVEAICDLLISDVGPRDRRRDDTAVVAARHERPRRGSW